jgi:hypothetical protein
MGAIEADPVATGIVVAALVGSALWYFATRARVRRRQ